MQQTAVEYLQRFMEQHQYFIGADLLDAFYIAKQIERNQIEKAYTESNYYISSEQYYNENYNR
jgi:hypothetical protein